MSSSNSSSAGTNFLIQSTRRQPLPNRDSYSTQQCHMTSMQMHVSQMTLSGYAGSGQGPSFSRQNSFPSSGLSGMTSSQADAVQGK